MRFPAAALLALACLAAPMRLEAMAPVTPPEDRVAALERWRTAFSEARPSGISLMIRDPNYRLFTDILDRVLTEYVRPLTPGPLVDSAIEGLRKDARADARRSDHGLTIAGIAAMLASLDPYSAYLEGEEFRELRAQTQGEFGGIGVELAMDEATGLPRVIAPLDDTPAARSGLRAGDLITQVDGSAIQGQQLRDVVARLRGPTGTVVRLTIRRPNGGGTFTVSLTRDIITVRPVRALMEGDVAYIRIATFNAHTLEALEAAVKHMARPGGGRPAGLVLDLRNNPGGLFDQAVEVADLFLDQGEIVAVRGRDPASQRVYRATPGDVMNGLPIIVMLNAGSASASEIVAAALQDNGRALVLGTRSFGKGSVQTITTLSTSSALRLTTARYVRPSGAFVDCVGVIPNVDVQSPRDPKDTADRHQSTALCDPASIVTPRISVWRAIDACPNAERRPGTEDLPLACAVEAVQQRSLPFR